MSKFELFACACGWAAGACIAAPAIIFGWGAPIGMLGGFLGFGVTMVILNVYD